MAVIEFINVSKSFGEYTVLSGVSFSANAGDVVALMGENGAGKSTLMRILAGVYSTGTYTGEMKLNGVTLKLNDVPMSKKHGIAMVHQELGLFPDMTAAENLMLEELSHQPAKVIDWQKLYKTAQKYFEDLGFVVDVHKKVSELSTGAAQLVEIARALRQKPTVLIMDEPTSALTEKESEKLFKLIDNLRKQGTVIFYVSHRMEEIKKISNKVVVLRDGRIAGVEETKNLSKDQIIKWMVGREVAQIYPHKKEVHQQQKAILNVKNLSVTKGSQKILKNISFEIYPGEVLGVSGLMGAGRSELALTLFGFFGSQNPWRRHFKITGTVSLHGQTIQWNTPSEAVAEKIAMITEDRKNTGLFLNRSAAENMMVSILPQLGPKRRFGVIDSQQEQLLVQRMFLDLKIHGPGLNENVETYSGGNQQKIYLAKCLVLEPQLLILDEPTRGVDIGAKIEIYEIIQKLTDKGVAILLISSEMPELLGLSDRVLVMKQGEIMGSFSRNLEIGFNPEKIMVQASL